MPWENGAVVRVQVSGVGDVRVRLVFALQPSRLQEGRSLSDVEGELLGKPIVPDQDSPPLSVA